MASIGVRLPINYDSTDGFGMLKTVTQAIKQNFKMLILTNPGERVMNPEFGVGIKQFLFENFQSDVYTRIDEKIREQVNFYLPVVSIVKIEFGRLNQDQNILALRIEYAIPDISTRDLLEFTI